MISQIQPNQKYGNYTTTDKWIKRGSSSFVICRCDCGLEKAQSAYNLLRKKVGMCLSCKTSKQNFKHGQNTQEKITYEYHNWINLNHKKLLCERWSKSFEEFYKDTGNRPVNGYILLRKSTANPHSHSNSYWGHPRNRFYQDLQNKKFGMWTILEKDFERKYVTWLCQCDCGRKDYIPQSSLINKISTKCKSCAGSKKLKTHGYSRDLIYQTYYAMKNRCYYEKNKAFKHYGGRGIKVCQRWLDSFDNFVLDMGERPLNHSLDRIDVNGDYSPENCKWSDQKEQTKNRRKISDLQDEIKRLKDIIASNMIKLNQKIME